jgi:hypothetical protein
MEQGLYETIVSNQLKKYLETLDKKTFKTEALDDASSPVVLSQYLEAIIKRTMQSQETLEERIKLANTIITVARESEEDAVADEAKELLFVKKREEAEPKRPVTSLSQSSLFTGMPNEPSLVSELKKEILSSNRIDMLVSFLKWSGYSLIMDAIKTFTEKEGNMLRVITTSYMGATDAKVVEELSSLPHTTVRISYDTDRTRLHAKAYIFHRESGYDTAYRNSAGILPSSGRR